MYLGQVELCNRAVSATAGQPRREAGMVPTCRALSTSSAVARRIGHSVSDPIRSQAT